MQRPAAFADLLEAARRGEDGAWGVLYRGLAPGVLGYLRARGARDPEDVCGEVFWQVVRDLPSFEGDEPGFRSWVFVIAHRRLLDDVRRRRRRPEAAVDPGTLWEVAGAGDVETEAVGGLAAEELRAVLDELTPAQRDVLLLRIFGDLSVDQTARVLGRRPGAVKALQHRAIRVLRRHVTR